MKRSSFDLNLSTQRTRKQVFLERQIDTLVTRAALVELVVPYYSEGRKAHPLFALESMLRVYFMKQWFSLSDPAMEETYTPQFTQSKTSHKWQVAMCLGKCRELDKENKFSSDALIDQAQKIKAGIRAKVEHPFCVIKCQFEVTKVRYRGLKKDTLQLKMLFALFNLWMLRHTLMGAQA